MIDLKMDYKTADGAAVTLITDKGRLTYGGKPFPLMGYVGDTVVPDYWSVTGIHPTDPRRNLKQATKELFINVYFNGNVGVFEDLEFAKNATLNARSSIRVEYVPGVKQF